jgi:hypothetical protein
MDLCLYFNTITFCKGLNYILKKIDLKALFLQPIKKSKRSRPIAF